MFDQRSRIKIKIDILSLHGYIAGISLGYIYIKKKQRQLIEIKKTYLTIPSILKKHKFISELDINHRQAVMIAYDIV